MSNKVSKEFLQKQYLVENKTLRTIATELGTSMATIHRLMVSYDIPRRSLKGLPKSIEHRIKLSAAKQNLWAGDKNPNWKGGVSLNRPRGLAHERSWSKMVKLRDNHICQWCGLDGKVICPHCGVKPEMHSDHIKSWADNPELRFTVANGRTLCAKCHRSTLGKRGELLETPNE